MKTLLAAALVGLALAASAAGAAADASYTDPAGDPTDPTAPDITDVQVTSTPDGVVSFRVTIANYQTLPPLSGVAVGLDVDKRPETGDGGVDVMLAYVVDPWDAPVVGFARWDENEDELVDVDPIPAAVSATFSGGVLTITAPRSELFYPISFRFAVVSLILDGLFDADPAFDLAPDGESFWTYDLAPLPPPALSASPVAATKRPAAGKRLVVTTTVTRTDKSLMAPPVETACTARVGTAKMKTSSTFVPTTEPVSLGEGKAVCVLNVPKNARGKTLRGTITARSAGASVTKQFSFRVV